MRPSQPTRLAREARGRLAAVLLLSVQTVRAGWWRTAPRQTALQGRAGLRCKYRRLRRRRNSCFRSSLCAVMDRVGETDVTQQPPPEAAVTERLTARRCLSGQAGFYLST